MDYETWLEYQAIQTIEEPNPIPEYDPYEEEQMTISDYEVETWRLEAQLSNLLGEEVKL